MCCGNCRSAQPLLCLQYCAQNFLSESALEAVEAGRTEFAATLMDMGLLPPSFQAWLQQQSKNGATAGESELHEFDAYCNNARIIKAALCAGKLPSPPPPLPHELNHALQRSLSFLFRQALQHPAAWYAEHIVYTACSA